MSRPRALFRPASTATLFGFGKPDEKGVWKGLDVDTAKAIAAAIFGDAEKVKYTAVSAKTRFHRPAIRRD